MHILKDGGRGGTLEVIVTRMKALKRGSGKHTDGSTNEYLRIVAVSATVPNSKDIAHWLRDRTGRDATLL